MRIQAANTQAPPPASQTQKAARQHDIFFSVGIHYWTACAPDVCRSNASEYARQLRVMKQANPELLTHFQYVTPKGPAQRELFDGIRGAFDSMSLNALELPAALASLDSTSTVSKLTRREQLENAGNALAGAMELASGLDLDRVQVHGMYSDVFAFKEGVDIPRARLAALRSRFVVTAKLAGDSGEVRSPGDLIDMLPTLSAEGIISLFQFAEAVYQRFPNADFEHVVRHWYYETPDGEILMCVPNRGSHDTTGGTVSSGDTIDFSNLVFSRPEPAGCPLVRTYASTRGAA